MTRHTPLPPFLQKLKTITETITSEIADWSDDGMSYIVKDSDKFEEVLKQHFKGSLQTFIRQLHFYGFRKLDAHNGGWSFAHKNFLRDKPDLVTEIRRKTRSDTNANGAATQVEVLELRSQVAKLQDVVEDLRTQLDSVLNVLDSAGVVDVVKKCDGKVNSVRLPISLPAGSPLAQASLPGRKRLRSLGDTGMEPEEDEEIKDTDDDSPSSSKEVDMDDEDDSRLDGEDEVALNEEDNMMVTEDDDDLNLKSEPQTSAEPLERNRTEDNLLEPLPIDFDGMLEVDIFDLEESSNFFDSTTLVDELEADVKRISESAVPPAAVPALSSQLVAPAPASESATTTAKVVADATQLDPASVQKVLAFLKKAMKAESSKPGSSTSTLKSGIQDLLSFPQIQNAVLNYKNALPTQEVGAN